MQIARRHSVEGARHLITVRDWVALGSVAEGFFGGTEGRTRLLPLHGSEGQAVDDVALDEDEEDDLRGG